MEYSSTFVRYERRGNRVVPVRVTKQWVTQEGMRGQLKAEVFSAVRVTELRGMPRGNREQAPEAWSSYPEQVESRERVLGLVAKYELECGGEPVLRCAGHSDPTLAMGSEPLTMRQVEQPMDAEPDTREWHMRHQWAEMRGFGDDEDRAAA